MGEGTVNVEIRCVEENLVVGHIEIGRGEEVLLTPERVWASFVPAADERRLYRQMQNLGDTLKCPKCKAMLTVPLATQEKPDKITNREMMRAKLRRQAISDLNKTDYITIRRKTHKVVGRKHVKSVAWPEDQSPIVLGHTKVKIA